MRSFIRLCAERPVAVIMALVALLVGSVFAASRLSLERLPELAVPRVVVEASYPGMGASEVRSLIVLPLEDALSSVKGVASLRSVSRDALASVVLEFAWGENPEQSSVRVREAIDAVYPSLPEGAQKPVALPYDADPEPFMVVSVRSRNGDLSLARRLAEYELRSRLRRVEGIGRVAIAGGTEKEAFIEMDLRKAAGRGLTATDVAEAVARECMDVSAGTVTEGESELVVVASGRPESIDVLGALIAAGRNGAFRLSDLARTRERDAKRKSAFVSNGTDCVCLELYRRPRSDPVAASRLARAEIARAVSDFSRDAELEILCDSSIPIARGIRDLALSALLGAIAAAAVLSFFLRDIRSSFLIAMTIPISVAASVVTLGLAGKSLNGMSLGGIALGIGLISDNAVVVLHALSSAFGSLTSRPSPRAIARVSASVATSTLAGMLTTAVVFVPILFLPGPIGALFSDLALSLIAANVVGWAVALFALPALYRVFWKPTAEKRADLLERLYRKPLASVFREPVFVILFSVVAALFGIALVLSRPASFLPAASATELLVSFDFPSGASLERVAREGSLLSGALRNAYGIERVFGRAGAEKDDSVRRADVEYRRERLVLRCSLKNGVDADRAAASLRSIASSTKPADTEVSVSLPSDPAALVLGLTGASRLAATGTDREEAVRRGREAAEHLRNEAGNALASVRVKPLGTRSEIRLFPDREASASLGASMAETAAVLRIAAEGDIVGRLEIDGRSMDVRVGGERMAKNAHDAVALVPVSPLRFTASAVSRVTPREAEGVLARKDRSDTVYIEAIAAAGKENALNRAIEKTLRALPNLERDDASAFKRYGVTLIVTVCLSIVLLYLTLGAQFESFVLPFIMLTTIPLALAGAGPALLLVGAGLDSGSVLGLVVLFGTAVNNAIILYETSEARATNGASGVVASYAGAIERVRPVLVTTLTTVFALLPVVLSPGGSTQRSMS
ncbi:MAG: efflux RND transporter permease subunit, partial [Treponemataceae bacterium]